MKNLILLFAHTLATIAMVLTPSRAKALVSVSVLGGGEFVDELV